MPPTASAGSTAKSGISSALVAVATSPFPPPSAASASQQRPSCARDHAERVIQQALVDNNQKSGARADRTDLRAVRTPSKWQVPQPIAAAAARRLASLRTLARSPLRPCSDGPARAAAASTWPSSTPVPSSESSELHGTGRAMTLEVRSSGICQGDGVPRGRVDDTRPAGRLQAIRAWRRPRSSDARRVVDGSFPCSGVTRSLIVIQDKGP